MRLYDPEADRILKAARNSPSTPQHGDLWDSRIREALRYSTYGINGCWMNRWNGREIVKGGPRKARGPYP